MAHRTKGSNYHPARVSGEQKFLLENAVNKEFDRVKKDGKIKKKDEIVFKKT